MYCQSAGSFQISRSFENLTALLEGFLQEACTLQNSSIAYSTLLALRDIAALATAIPPVLHHREHQVCYINDDIALLIRVTLRQDFQVEQLVLPNSITLLVL